MKEKARLRCIKPRKDFSEQPRFRLAYQGRVWEFEAGNNLEAGQVARYHLDYLQFGRSNILYVDDYVQQNRILYTWEEANQ